MWRFFALRLNGDGTEVGLHPQLPLTSCQITDPLSAPTEMQAKLSPESGLRSLLVPWSTALYAEKDGAIRAGAIVTKVAAAGPELAVTCTGWSGYIAGMPWVDKAMQFIASDPGPILSMLWATVQAHKHGNLGLAVPSVATGRKVGTKTEKLILAQYATADLSSFMTDLLVAGNLEYLEHHEWDGEQITHRLLVASPRIGRRNPSARLVVGENVIVVPSVDDADYASEVLVLGAGEGTKKVMARSVNPAPPRLRRVWTVNDETITRSAAATDAAQRVLRLLTGTAQDVEQIVVFDSPSAPVDALAPGDEVLLSGPAGWAGDLEVWLRILSRAYDPIASPDQVTLEVARADKVATS